ncbi:glycine-rich protein-like [Neocloeon triangulifer]|uniref:glycine-rich protein-like n=1 Tax=Neocloeon triangulifer TaxID=2078957 RepID=UPI00286F1AD1|nr:glycine-rich protein-like [Neocloeon triangulifer]
MKFLVCIALLVAVASAEPGVLGYNNYNGYNAYNSYGYGSPYGHYAATPVVKAIAPVATSYANVHSVSHAAPIAYRYGHNALAYGRTYGSYGRTYGSYGRNYGQSYGAYPSSYGYGYKNYAHGYGLHGLHY